MKEKTRLQIIMGQKTEQMRIAIEQAIDDGAQILNSKTGTHLLEACYIDGLYVQKQTDNDTISVILDFSSEKIAKAFKQSLSREELERMAEQKRSELEDIENKLKNLNEYETDND